MKAIILPCTPSECEKIVNGDMSILVRKKVPKESNLPIKIYIYCGKTYSENVLLIDKETKEAYFGDYRNGCCCDIDGYVDCFIADDNVIGEFICDKVDKYEPHVILCAYYEVNGADVKENMRYNKGTCLSYEDMVKKSNGKPVYGVRISDLKIYDEPKEWSEFRACDGNCNHCKHRIVNPNDVGDVRCENIVTRPPKNYIYVEE